MSKFSGQGIVIYSLIKIMNQGEKVVFQKEVKGLLKKGEHDRELSHQKTSIHYRQFQKIIHTFM